ncbi:MAG: FecR domain-containing protein [Polyangiaceae bacterium]
MISAGTRKRYDFRSLMRRAHPEMSAEQEVSGWHLLRQRGLLRERRARRLRVFAGCVVLSVIGLVGGYLLARPRPSPLLAYAVSGGRVEPNGVVHVDAPEGGLLRFSDGSVVRLLQGTASRLVQLTPNGARLRVNDGALDVVLESRPESSFEFDLGAYALTAHDATFSGQLREREDVLEVRVFSGAIELDGPLASDGLTLRAGQVLTIRRADGAIVVRDAKAESIGG